MRRLILSVAVSAVAALGATSASAGAATSESWENNASIGRLLSAFAASHSHRPLQLRPGVRGT